MSEKLLTFEAKKMLENRIETLKKDSEQTNRILNKGLKRMEVNSDEYIRVKKNLKVDETIYKRIKELNKETKQPMWRILEMIIETSNIQSKNKEEHREPDICPECGSTDLLIQSGDYSWYCYECEENGHY